MESTELYDYKRIKDLYKEAFPREERIPLPILALAAKRKGIAIEEYFEEGLFAGFTYSVSDENMVFVMFFAVDGKLRNQGLGSKILTHLKEKNESKVIVLNVEPLDERADNYLQRLNRVKFYNKNGFYDTGYFVHDVGGRFSVFSTGKRLDTKNYAKLCRYVSFGLWRGKLTL